MVGQRQWLVCPAATDADLRTLQHVLDTGAARAITLLATFVLQAEEELDRRLRH